MIVPVGTAKIKLRKRSACQAFTQQALEVVSENLSGLTWQAQDPKSSWKKSAMKIPRSNQQLKIFEQQPEQELQTWQPVRDDFNFCRLALFSSADKNSDRFRDIKQQYTVESGGKSFKAVWEVRHDPELGLLGTFDRDVWMGILEIAESLVAGHQELILTIHLASLCVESPPAAPAK